MGYTRTQMGTLYLGGIAQRVPKDPHCNGDVPQYDRVSEI